MHLRALMAPALLAAGVAAGFGRELLLACIRGATREVEVFRLAFGLPSIFSNSIAVSLVTVLIPTLLNGPGKTERDGFRKALWSSLDIWPWAGRSLMPPSSRHRARG